MNIRDAEIHEAVDVIRVGDAERYRGLIRGRPAADVQNHPDIRKLKIRRRGAVTHGQNASAEDLFVVAGRPLDVGDGEKVRDANPLSRGHLIALLFDLYGVHRWLLSIQCSLQIPRFGVPLPSAQFGPDGTSIEPEENGLRNWTMVLPILSYRPQHVTPEA